MEDRPQPTDVCGKGDVSVEDDDATKVMGENLGQGELEEAEDTIEDMRSKLHAAQKLVDKPVKALKYSNIP